MVIVPEELYDALEAADELLDRLIEANRTGDMQARKYVYDRLSIIARKIKEIRART